MKQEDTRNRAVSSASTSPLTLAQFEMRGHMRSPVSIDAEAVELTTLTSVFGRATDLGVGGCFVDTIDTLPVGTQVGIRFTREGRRFHCRALVTHVVTGQGMSLAFTEADPNEEASVLEWVSELGGLPS